MLLVAHERGRLVLGSVAIMTGQMGDEVERIKVHYVQANDERIRLESGGSRIEFARTKE